jgi:hypothetical protein
MAYLCYAYKQLHTRRTHGGGDVHPAATPIDAAATPIAELDCDICHKQFADTASLTVHRQTQHENNDKTFRFDLDLVVTVFAFTTQHTLCRTELK